MNTIVTASYSVCQGKKDKIVNKRIKKTAKKDNLHANEYKNLLVVVALC